MHTYIHTYWGVQEVSLNTSMAPKITWPVMALTDMRALKLRLKVWDGCQLATWMGQNYLPNTLQPDREALWLMSFHLKGMCGSRAMTQKEILCLKFRIWLCFQCHFKLWDSKLWETNGPYGACDFCSLIISLHDTLCSVDLRNFDDSSSLNCMATACIETTSSAPQSNHTATTKTRNRAWTLVIATLCEKVSGKKRGRERERKCQLYHGFGK